MESHDYRIYYVNIDSLEYGTQCPWQIAVSFSRKILSYVQTFWRKIEKVQSLSSHNKTLIKRLEGAQRKSLSYCGMQRPNSVSPFSWIQRETSLLKVRMLHALYNLPAGEKRKNNICCSSKFQGHVSHYHLLGLACQHFISYYCF